MIRTPGVPRNASHVDPAVLVLARIIATAARPWTDQALCAQADPDAFFSDSIRQISLAKLICQRCPVQESCLSQALDAREEFGVWGGLDGTERQRLLRRKRHSPGGPDTA